MAYQITNLIQECGKEETQFILDSLNSYVNFADNKGMKELFEAWNEGIMPEELAIKIERELRYTASNDLAYVVRKTLGHDPAGIPMEEAIEEAAKFLKVNVKRKSYYSVEDMLKQLALKTVGDVIDKMTVEEQLEAIKAMGITKEAAKEFLKGNKKKAVIIMQFLLKQGLEAAVLKPILQAIILEVAGTFIGKEAAKVVLKAVLTKLPTYGFPLTAVAGVAWTIVDVAGPSRLKATPAILALAEVCLRKTDAEDLKTHIRNHI